LWSFLATPEHLVSLKSEILGPIPDDQRHDRQGDEHSYTLDFQVGNPPSKAVDQMLRPIKAAMPDPH
jgi:hypothetical protein